MEYNFPCINSHIIIYFEVYFYCKSQQGGNTLGSLDFLKEHSASFNQRAYCVYNMGLGALRGHGRSGQGE